MVNPGAAEVSNTAFLEITFPTSSISLVPLTSATLYALGGASQTAVVADFNGDGKLDVATLSVPGSSVTILLGNGDGTFQSAMTFSVGAQLQAFPWAIVAGDFNSDGKTDLAVAVPGCAEIGCYTPGSVAILLGNGDGTFQTPVYSPTDYGPISIVAADFNGDGRLDLAIGNFAAVQNGNLSNPTVAVLLGNGDGTFQPFVEFPMPASRDLIVGDFNGDGIVDLATDDGFNSADILLGNGDGTFQPYLSSTVGTLPQGIATADVNSDGKLDLLLPNTCGNAGDGCNDYGGVPGSVSVLLGNGDGTFQPHVEYTVGISPASVAIVDFNGDGKLDLVIGTWCGGNSVCEDVFDQLSFLFGNGDGTFQPQVVPIVSFGGPPYPLLTGDLNGDGLPDIASPIVGYGYGYNIMLQSTLTLSNPSLTFDDQTVGTSSQPRASTLNNISTKVPITISGTQVTGTNASDFSVKTTCSKLWAKSACKVNVTFKPTAPGTRTATVVVTDSAVGSPHQITVTGTGRHRK